MFEENKLITRFAPSPTGLLHLGHAYSAKFAYDKAIENNGKFLLRLEDIDTTRCHEEYEKSIIEDLKWLGLSWDGEVRKQSLHFDFYKKALSKLDDMGVLYPCFCSRKDIKDEINGSVNAPHGPDGFLYPGICKKLSNPVREELKAENKPFALRLDMERALEITGRLYWFDKELGKIEARPEIFGDIVLARKDVPTSYHLSVTLDDDLQNVSLVTRGKDLLEATHIHRLLQALLGLNVPEYEHHKLLLDKNGKRFAKRNKSVTIRSLRELGYTPSDLFKPDFSFAA